MNELTMPDRSKVGRFVYVKSTNPNAQAHEWEVVPPDEVPLDLKDPDVLGRMVAMPGYMASPRHDHETFYMVLRVDGDTH